METLPTNITTNLTTWQVVKCGLLTDFKTTIDEHGKFSYYSSDMRPVPPGELKYLAIIRSRPRYLSLIGRLV